jgi:hypothetical protein
LFPKSSNNIMFRANLVDVTTATTDHFIGTNSKVKPKTRDRERCKIEYSLVHEQDAPSYQAEASKKKA